MNLFLGGLSKHNVPPNKALDLQGCKDMIVVDRKYFLQHKDSLVNWALSTNDDNNNVIIDQIDGINGITTD